MLGWEYPPYFAGGLGTHVYNLTKELSKLGVKIYFINPPLEEGSKPVRLRGGVAYLKHKINLSSLLNLRDPSSNLFALRSSLKGRII